jgi:outer membrane PBP1 activator LpoA protein
LRLAQTDLAIPPADMLPPPPPNVRISLLLPTQSETLHQAAEVVRAGFEAAYEREPIGIDISIVETGDAPQDVVSGYTVASAESDIVVGPLTRSGVSAVAQSGAVAKPTIALATPETPEDAEIVLPPQMLVMGLSVEGEARQVADWAWTQHPGSKVVVLSTSVGWQRRAAKAFGAEWQQRGGEVQPVELNANGGFLSGRELLQLKKEMEQGGPAFLFAALDARQARQVRAIMGTAFPLYGTSQLNPFTLSDRGVAEQVVDMDGIRLVDIPWQLQPDHPAVMAYPKLVIDAVETPNPTLERLYALGIDAYRVAHEIAEGRSDFVLDGVTGRLVVRFDQSGAHFSRSAPHAVYRDGSVVATVDAQ